MYRFIKTVAALGTVWLIFVLVMFPKACIDAGLKGVFLCLDTVIPSLFPFFVCSGLITGLGMTKPLEKLFAPFMKPLFGVSGAGALPFVLGILSGYPVGAKCVADLYSKGYCSKKEGEKLLAFCNNSGPLFILGAVGAGMIENVSIGRYLYIIHILSAFITGIIFKFYKTETIEIAELPAVNKAGFTKTVLDAFSGATQSIISVCGYVILFSVVGEAMPKMGISPLFHGILEITGGTEKILNMPVDFNLRLALVSGVIAFSGVSVMLQVGGIIGKTNLSPKLYFMGKAVQGAVAYVLTIAATKMLPVTESTLSIASASPDVLWKYSVTVALISFIIIAFLYKKAVDN